MLRKLVAIAVAVVKSAVATALVTGFFYALTVLATGQEGTSWILVAEELHEVGGPTFEAPGLGFVAVGYLTETSYLWSVFGLAFTTKGFVLVPDTGDGQYYELDETRLKALRGMGLIPPDLGIVPTAGLLVYIKGLSFWIILSLPFIWLGSLFIRGKLK